MSAMKLLCYLTGKSTVDIRPGKKDRTWMDETRDAYAYRCLPLSMANQHGWQIQCPVGFEAEWTGEPGKEAVHIICDEGARPPIISNFGAGILTFSHDAILRTPPGFNLWVTGPPNTFKDGIQPLSALVETDWLPFTFTMNWKFTRPNTRIRFSPGVTYCFIFPVPRGLLEEFEPETLDLSADAVLERRHRHASSRRYFSKLLPQTRPDYTPSKRLHWQGWYTEGVYPDKSGSPPEHQRGLRLRPFREGGADGADEPGPAGADIPRSASAFSDKGFG